VGGNSEILARRAAARLPGDVRQTWISLADHPLPPFIDVRHSGDGTYPPPEGPGAVLLEATLAATDLVFVAPLYWYGLPSAAKLYLDHWSGWMRVPGLDFRPRMAAKTFWAITAISDEDAAVADPLFNGLMRTADYLKARWGGALHGYGTRPGDVLSDHAALVCADHFFTGTDDR
jgi:hypothetical protein